MGVGFYAVEGGDQGRAEDHGEECEERKEIEHGNPSCSWLGIAGLEAGRSGNLG